MQIQSGETVRMTFLRSWEASRRAVRIIEGDTRLTCDEFGARAWALSEPVDAIAGREPGHVGVVLPNGAALAAALAGVWLTGRAAAPLNPGQPPEELRAQAEDSQARLILTSRALAPLLEPLAQKKKDLTILTVDEPLAGVEERLARNEKACPDPAEVIRAGRRTDSENPACLLYTSGASGPARGVTLSHCNLLANVESCRRLLGSAERDTFLAALPLYHAFGLTVSFLLPLLTGGRVVLPGGRFQPAEIPEWVAREEITILPMTPSLAARALGALSASPRRLGSLRYCISGGAPLAPALEAGWREAAGLPLLNGYGLTEASPVVTVNLPPEAGGKPGTAGQAIPDVRVEIWDEEDRSLPAGREGRVVVRGANVMKGYWRRADETSRALAEGGWLRTGDLGRLDADGFLTILGPEAEMIHSGGQALYPAEIEAALLELPEIEEAAVAGRPDPVKGEVPVAWVIPREGAGIDERTLRAGLRGRLEEAKIPREFRVTAVLPRSPLGRVLKRKL